MKKVVKKIKHKKREITALFVIVFIVLGLIAVAPKVVKAFGGMDFGFFFGGTVNYVVEPCPPPCPSPCNDPDPQKRLMEYKLCTAGMCVPGQNLVILSPAYPEKKVGPLSLSEKNKGNICLLPGKKVPPKGIKILGFGPAFNNILFYFTTGKGK